MPRTIDRLRNVDLAMGLRIRTLMVFLLLLRAWACSAQSTCTTADCPVVGEPSISDCVGGLDKYLSRAMSIKGLVNYNAQVPWENPCNDPAYACAQPLKTCPNGYCPTRYCEDINIAVGARAALLLDVASTWGDEWKLVPGTSWYHAAAKCVQDINRAYDCAGLERPIVGASILEWVSKAIEEKPIPERIIRAFANDADFKASDFTTGARYDITRIERADRRGTPDISNLQARMWVYQCATTFIDMGYRQIELDVVGWSLVNGFESARAKSYELVNRIRDYARSRGTFVLLSSSAKDVDFFYDNHMLFDFRVAPLRPMEMRKSPDALCAGPSFAVIDPKIGETYSQTSGGTAPGGCVYDRIPFVVVFDNHAGICGTPGIADKMDYCIWGYDESTWFSTLPQECQVRWLRYAVNKVREISPRGYVAMPAKLFTGPSPSSYRLHDNPTVNSAITEDYWRIDSSPEWMVSSKQGRLIGTCGGNSLRFDNRYTLSAVGPDLTSIITWHIQRPDSTWEPVTYGASRQYLPKVSGSYNIVMRQDNIGLQQAASSPREVKKTIYMEATSCSNIFKTAARMFGF